MSAPTSLEEPVYEMLWDCKFCGTRKLLGLTHRHCPSCGGPQNAEERYFPSDAEKVPAQSHVYFGADVTCAHCGVANSKNSKHCGGCGAPLDGGREVARRHDQVAFAGEGFAGQTAADARRERSGEPLAGSAPAEPEKRGRGRTILRFALGVGLVAIALVVTLLVWKREGGFEVVAHSWQREIAVERLGSVSDSSWCDSMPLDARGIARHREVRSHERVPDGEECHTRRVDNGNGTFAERRECTPKYREDPVYADRCTFTVDRWRKVRSATAEGTSVSDAPRWPATGLARTGGCLGCEREGARTETYTVVLRDRNQKDHPCDFDQQRWASLTDGSSLRGEVRVLSGGLDCASLRAP